MVGEQWIPHIPRSRIVGRFSATRIDRLQIPQLILILQALTCATCPSLILARLTGLRSGGGPQYARGARISTISKAVVSSLTESCSGASQSPSYETGGWFRDSCLVRCGAFVKST